MDKDTIDSNTKIILKFYNDNFKGQRVALNPRIEDLDYRFSWDDLMPVVGVITNLETFYRVNILNQSNVNYCSIIRVNPDFKTIVSEGGEMTALQATYEAVIQFINFYNSQNKQNNG